MILRVEVDSFAASVDLENASWTPELLQTFLRYLGDQVVFMCRELAAEEIDGTDGTETEAPPPEAA